MLQRKCSEKRTDSILPINIVEKKKTVSYSVFGHCNVDLPFAKTGIKNIVRHQRRKQLVRVP